MNNLLHSVPENQKEKISKLLDIWERGHTFPLDMLAAFKQQLSGNQNSKLFVSHSLRLSNQHVLRRI